MSFYGIGIMGSLKSARDTARSWGVRLYDVEALGSLDANGEARCVGVRASLRYGKKLDRWYKHSGVRIKEIDAATPPEAIAYLKGLRPEERLSLELRARTINRVRSFLKAHQPVRAAAQ